MYLVVNATFSSLLDYKLNCFRGFEILYSQSLIERIFIPTNSCEETMLDFNTYVIRHGEFGAQSLLEMIERREGIVHGVEAPLPLEERWNAVMCSAFEPVAV